MKLQTVCDRLVVIHQGFQKKGLGKDETLLDLTGSLDILTRNVAAAMGTRGLSTKLSIEVWTMYWTDYARRRGLSPRESHDSVLALVRSLEG